MHIQVHRMGSRIPRQTLVVGEGNVDATDVVSGPVRSEICVV
jgi:hypothetical protein